MKKVKLLLLAFIVFFGFALTTYAEEYSVSYNKEVLTQDDKLEYDITINSNDLPDDLELTAYVGRRELSYTTTEHQLYTYLVYDYKLTDKKTNNPITEIDGNVEILIHQEGLTEGTKYDVYYFDDLIYPCLLDDENLGDKAEVVKINDKLYIKLVTSTLKPFGLEKEMSNEYKKELEKITKDGYFIFPATKPTIENQDGIYDIFIPFYAFNEDDNDIIILPTEEYDKTAEYQYLTLTFKDIPNETHIVKYKWQEEKISQNLVKKFEKVKTTIKENTKSLAIISEGRNGVGFTIEDMQYINYLQNNIQKENIENVVNYSAELKEIFENSNFNYYFDFRAGSGGPFNERAFGHMILQHNDLIYSDHFDAGYYIKQVIYIPDNTENTHEAYIAAAKKRITEYLEIDDIKIEIGGTREEITKEAPHIDNFWKYFFNEKKLSDYYYNITINGQTIEFVFEKNSEKIKQIDFKTKDLETEIEINTNSGSIPLDTLIEVDVIGKNHKEFKEILETLKKEDGMIYDLKLYSETLRKYITKLDNGKFKVRIPLKTEFKNKKLKAYYIDDNNKIEEYNITIENGYAVFETEHFSTYTIAESGEITNPSTLDNITTYILLGIMSTIGLTGTIFYFKKRNNY